MATKVASRSLYAPKHKLTTLCMGCKAPCVTAFCDGCAPPAYRWACGVGELVQEDQRNLSSNHAERSLPQANNGTTSLRVDRVHPMRSINGF